MLETLSPYLLAILQGIAEFLPISSSGHLVLLNSVFSTDLGLAFDLALHFATLISVVAFYWRDIVQICVNCVKELAGKKSEAVQSESVSGEIEAVSDKKNLKFVGCLIAATAVTGTLGLLLDDWVENELRSPLIVGILLIINAGILWMSKKNGLFRMTEGALTLKTALLIGLVQGLAVLPGISRSGSTITAALLLGVSSQDCAKISFLLSIPVILGAIVLHAKDLVNIDSGSIASLCIASVLAAVVGYVSLVLLNKMLKKASFHYFAPYCLGIGLIAVVCSLTMSV